MRKSHLTKSRNITNDHSSGDILARLRSAIDTTAKRIRVSPTCRVVEWCRLLEKFSAADKRQLVEQMIPYLQSGQWETPWSSSLQALVECRMFIEIIEQLCDDLDERDLRDLISGALHAADDSSKTRGRDRQFELFVGALCCRAGLEVSLAEPDLLVSLKSGPIALAAKRLRSRNKIHKNIKKAADQIAGVGVRGFVVIDVSSILDPNAQAITHWRYADQQIGGAILCLVNREYPREFASISNGLVDGVILRAAVPMLSEGFRFGTYETWWPVQGVGNGETINEFLEVFYGGVLGT
jgi:hypothetical protein